MIDTIIIGAGIAGLAAGQYMTEKSNSNFLVLESADSIGGRVNTTDFGGITFSIGPGWLHGCESNQIYDIINNLGIKIEKCEYENAFFVWDVCNSQDITDTFNEKSLLFAEALENVEEKVKDIDIDVQESVATVFQKYYYQFNSQSDIDKVVVFVNKEIYIGAPLKMVSAIGEFNIDEIYSKNEKNLNFRILDPLGLLKMIDHLSRNFKDKIKTRCKVDSIIWNYETHSAHIITNDGQRFTCKNVIITLQSALLAKNVIKFEPNIPFEKELAWKHVPSVNYCRIFAKFPRRFWPDKEWLVCVTENVDPFNELILWQNCSKQNLCSYHDNILICHFTSGYDRTTCRFDVDKTSLLILVEEAMKNICPSSYCKPDDVMFVSHWNSDRFAGSFSISAPGLSKDMISALGKRIGPLYFAGESVSVEQLGTMQGAYITGREAAEQTLN